MKRAYTIKSVILSLFMVFLASGHLYGGSAEIVGQSTETPGIEIQNAPEFKEGELIVKFKPNVSKGKKDQIHGKHGSRKSKEFSRFDIDHVQIRTGTKVKDAMATYKAEPDVLYAEPNYKVAAQAIPNDPFFNQLWGLFNTGQTGGTPGADIDAPNAWNLTTGSTNIVIAVLDTGVDYNHADLSANIWVNTGEIAGNGIDDDGNGYLDDIHGIDTLNNDTNPFDDNGHGTHVAGTIGALGNNSLGVVGVNWDVRIMACKFIDANGYGFVDGALRCLDYVKAMKARGVNIVATNNSWGGLAYSQALYDAINSQRDILFFAAAGNGYGGYNDIDPVYPASYYLPNVIAVTATDHNDAMAGFANFGRRSVHLGAPGQSILSTLPSVNYWGIVGGYGSFSGTSMATPHVTGVAALLKAQNPSRSWIDIKNLILSGGDTVASMTGNTVTGKRLNAFGSLSCVNGPLFSVLAYPAVFTVGTQELLSALSINCAAPVGPVTATSSAGETVTLRDDGVTPDLAAGDGIFSASWMPARSYTQITFSSLAGTESVVPRLPDLAVTSVAGPASARTEELVTVTVTVNNLGVDRSGAHNVGLYLSSDGTITTSDMLIGSHYVQTVYVGQEQTLTFSVPIPASVVAGTYYFGVIADYDNGVVESNEVNNGLTGNQIALTLPLRDLTVTAVSGPASANSDQLITVTATVSNQGPASVGAFNVGFYLSTDAAISTADVVLGVGSVSSLAAGAQKTITARLWVPAGLPDGSYFIGAIADNDSAVAETNEVNNALAGNQIAVTRLYPDMTMLAVSAPAFGTPGQSIAVNMTLKNQGQFKTGQFVIGIFLSPDPVINIGDPATTDLMIGSMVLPDVAAGAQRIVSYFVRIPTNVRGTFYVGAIADYDRAVVELNETNNGLAGNQIVIGLPDLIPVTVSGPASAFTGQAISATATVGNQGPVQAGQFNVGLYLSTDPTVTTSDVLLATAPVTSLAAGAQRVLNYSAVVPTSLAAGTYYVGVVADYSSAVAESDETNNGLAGNQIVITKGFPDMIVSAVSGPATVGTGQAAAVSVTVRNQGQSVSGSSNVGIYLSTDPTITTADTFLGSGTISALAAGAQQTLSLSVTIPSNLAPGTYYIGALADYLNTVAESDETNNGLAGNQIVITAAFPDLIVTSVSAPLSANTEQVMTVTAIVRNQGPSVAGSFTVGIYLSADTTITTGDTLLGNRQVASLAGGGQQTLSITVAVPANLTSGTYIIGAIADYTNTVAESDETNNAFAGNQIAITKVFPDLSITAVSGPVTANTEQLISVSVTVRNLGPINVSSFNVGIYLSADATITTGDLFIGSRAVSSLIAGGQQVLSATVTIPASLTSSTYFIGAISDYTGAIVESNETNNVFTGNQIAITKVFPDLVMTSVSGPLSAAKGQLIAVTSTVKNQGLGGVGGFSVGLYLSTDPAITTGDIFIGSGFVSSLGIGASRTLNSTVTVPAGIPSGTYYIGAMADYSSTQTEADETNNALAGNQIVIP